MAVQSPAGKRQTGTGSGHRRCSCLVQHAGARQRANPTAQCLCIMSLSPGYRKHVRIQAKVVVVVVVFKHVKIKTEVFIYFLINAYL